MIGEAREKSGCIVKLCNEKRERNMCLIEELWVEEERIGQQEIVLR